MLPRNGDLFECPQCSMLIEVRRGTSFTPLQCGDLHCCCGETMILLQSGSESVEDAPEHINKIVRAVAKTTAQSSDNTARHSDIYNRKKFAQSR
jgi:hypothetical protein